MCVKCVYVLSIGYPASSILFNGMRRKHVISGSYSLRDLTGEQTSLWGLGKTGVTGTSKPWVVGYYR